MHCCVVGLLLLLLDLHWRPWRPSAPPCFSCLCAADSPVHSRVLLCTWQVGLGLSSLCYTTVIPCPWGTCRTCLPTGALLRSRICWTRVKSRCVWFVLLFSLSHLYDLCLPLPVWFRPTCLVCLSAAFAGHLQKWIKDSSVDVDRIRSGPITLRDCFKRFAEREQLSEANTWYCSKCKEHRRAFKKMELWSPPEILIVHLKRFQYAVGQYFIHTSKVEDVVDFPLDGFDVSEFVAGSTPGAPAPIYDLFAVRYAQCPELTSAFRARHSCPLPLLPSSSHAAGTFSLFRSLHVCRVLCAGCSSCSNHMGGMGGGHYTAYARNFGTGGWFNLDDSYVTPGDPSYVVSKMAYVLFYRRRK